MMFKPVAQWCLPPVLPSVFAVLIAANAWAEGPLLERGVERGAEQGVQVQVLAKSGASWDGSRLPHYPEGTPEVSILKISIPPGMRLPVHEHPIINAGFLLSGRLKVVTEEGKTLDLNAGDSLVEVVGKWHYGVNEGTEPAVILVFYAGEADKPITVKK